MIQMTTAITRADYRALAYFNVFQRHPAEPYFVGTIAFLALGVLVAKCLPWFEPWQLLFHLSWVFWVLLLVVFAGIEGLTRQYLHTDGFIKAGQTYTYQFSRECICVFHQEKKQKILWQELFKVFELKKHYFFFISIYHAILVPKRAISAEDQERLCALCTEKMGAFFTRRVKTKK